MENSEKQDQTLDLFKLIRALERARFLDLVYYLEEVLGFGEDLDPSLLTVAVLLLCFLKILAIIWRFDLQIKEEIRLVLDSKSLDYFQVFGLLNPFLRRFRFCDSIKGF